MAKKFNNYGFVPTRFRGYCITEIHGGLIGIMPRSKLLGGESVIKCLN